LQMKNFLPDTVAHACNSKYPGGRDQKDKGLTSAWRKS
jgi:hypothetical protein